MDMMSLSINNKLPNYLFLISKISVLFTIVVIFFVGFFFSYPDTIELEIELKNNRASIFINADGVKDSTLAAHCLIPHSKIALINKDSKVKIQLTTFPKRKYGIINSKISKISGYPIDEKTVLNEPFYLANLHLDLPLVTSFNDTIPIENKLNGIAQIFLEEKNIFQRFYDEYLK